MKNAVKKQTLSATLVGTSLLFALALGGCGESNNTPATRLVLVAKDQAFHLENQPELPNPSITLKYGETVELVLRNDDPKQVVHCFTIGGLNVKTASNLDSGETETLTFKPAHQGVFIYACLLHPQMVGKIIVQ